MESHKELQGQKTLALQIIAALAIIILMPMSVYRGVSLFVTADYCAVHKKIQKKELDEAKQVVQSWNEKCDLLFLKVSIIVGLCGIAFGIYTSIAALGTSLILGSLVTIFHGYFAAWNNLSDKIIFISLLLAVLLLVGALYWYSRKK